MARTAGTKVTVDTVTRGKVEVEFTVDSTSATRDQLLKVSRNGYMNPLRAAIKAAIDGRGTVVKQWEAFVKQAPKTPQVKSGKLDLEALLAFQLEQVIASTGINPTEAEPEVWEYDLVSLIPEEE